MRRSLIILLAVLAVALPASVTAASRTPGFQVQADGLLFGPLGALPSQHDVKLSSLYGNGGGFSFTATLGLTPHWVAGVRVATFHSSKSGSWTFDDMVTPIGQSLAPGSGPYGIDRELTLLPIHALLQHRHALGARAEWLGECGAGVLSTTGHLTLDSSQGSGTLSSIAGYQKDFSWTVGTSLAWPVRGNLDLVASARYIGAVSGDGAVWVQSDDPSFTNWSLGLRYPHDTH